MAYQRRFIKINGHDWAYIKIGQGKPLMIIHGILSYADLYLPLARYLSSNYEVIIPDLPGFGFTKRLEMGNNYENIANELKELIPALGYKKMNVFGSSIGGLILLELINSNPNLIDHAIIQSAPWRKGDIKLPASESFFIHSIINKMPIRIVTFIKKHILLKILPALMSSGRSDIKETFKKYGDLINEAITLLDVKGNIDLLKSVENTDMENLIHKTGSKLLVISGDQDMHISTFEEERLAEKLDVKYIAIKGERHEIVIQSPDKVAEFINQFISRKGDSFKSIEKLKNLMSILYKSLTTKPS